VIFARFQGTVFYGQITEGIAHLDVLQDLTGSDIHHE